MIEKVLREMKKIGINQISKQVLKDFFAYRPHIHCTIADILRAAEKVGIDIKPCNTEIPVWFIPIKANKLEISKLKQKPCFNKEELFDLYITKNLGAKEISKLKKCYINTVYDSLRKHGIKREMKNTKLIHDTKYNKAKCISAL